MSVIVTYVPRVCHSYLRATCLELFWEIELSCAMYMLSFECLGSTVDF